MVVVVGWWCWGGAMVGALPSREGGGGLAGFRSFSTLKHTSRGDKYPLIALG